MLGGIRHKISLLLVVSFPFPIVCFSFKIKDKKVKKYRKIVGRLQGRLLEEIFSIEKKKWLIILNASFDSLVTGQQLLQVLQNWKGFQRVEMFLGESPCSYAEFETAEDAELCFEALDKKYCELLNRVLYLEYCNILPVFPQHPLITTFDIRGLGYVPEFIDRSFEQAILAKLKSNAGEFTGWKTLNKRKVLHFGYTFDYTNNKVTTAQVCEEFPKFCRELLQKYYLWYPNHPQLDQLTINHYEPGHGISPHIDDLLSFKGPIVIINLHGTTIMDFRKDGITKPCVLEPRSLLIMENEARLEWEHGIRPRKVDLINGLATLRKDRWSLTFRTVNNVTEC